MNTNQLKAFEPKIDRAESSRLDVATVPVDNGITLNQLNHVSQFAGTIGRVNLTKSDLCDALATQILVDMEPSAVLLCELDNDKSYKVTASYGVNEEWLSTAAGFSLDSQLPVSDVLKVNEIMIVSNDDNQETSVINYPNVSAYLPSGSWKSLVIFPVKTSSGIVGAVIVQTEVALVADEGIISFISAVANLSSISLDISKERRISKVPEQILNEQINEILTPRQISILKLISNDMTNVAIGKELGYSHSTIRHETMRIFSKLGLYNRGEARDLYLKSFAVAS